MSKWILEGDGWDDIDENTYTTKEEAEQGIVDFLANEYEAEKIRVTHNGEDVAVVISVRFVQ